MDVNKINNVILNQLNCIDGLNSLKLQNHIYGCFLIMEDIAQEVISLSDLQITYPNKSDTQFNLDECFGNIGLKYGFIMDERLCLDTFSPEYKNTWLECFKAIDLLHDISAVDTIEDNIIELLTNSIPPRYAFFINALDTGSLNDDWVAKVLQLIEPDNTVFKEGNKEQEPEIERKENIIEKQDLHKAQIIAASNEKMIKSHTNNKRNGAHKTRRNYLNVDLKNSNNTTQSKRKIIMTRRNKK